MGDAAEHANDKPTQSAEPVVPTQQGVESPAWGFVLAIATGQGPRGFGFLLNEEFALTSGTVARQFPEVAVEALLTGSKVQAVPAGTVNAGEIGELVVLRLLGPLDADRPPGFGQAQPGDEFTMPVMYALGQLATLLGVIGESFNGELRLDMAHDSPSLPPVAGSPVLVDGLVAGVVVSARGDQPSAVGLTEVAGELAAWAPEIRDAVWPVGPLAPAFDESAFSRGARRALRWFDAVAAANDPTIPAENAFWGALLVDARRYATTLGAVITTHLEAQENDASLPALGIPVTPTEPSAQPDPSRLAEMEEVLDLAATLRDTTLPGETVHRRHLVVALFLLHPEPIVDAGADRTRLRDELLTAIRETAPSDDQTAWQAAFERPAAAVPKVRAHQRAGYHADAVDAAGALTDELHVSAEVNTMCDVLAAKDAVPPISVGLFGRWGTGKSYFMALMQERMARLAAAAAEHPGQTAYCPNIVQISFNAWHYMDANLWASLAVRIFEGLSAADHDQEDADEAGRLLAELNRREKELATIDQKLGRALDDPTFKAAAAKVGLESARMDLLTLTGEVTRFRGLLRAAWAVLTRPGVWAERRRRVVRWALVAAMTLLIVVGVMAVSAGGWRELRGALLAVAVPVIAAFSVALRQVKLVHTGLRAANDALGRVGLEPKDVSASRADEDHEIHRIKQRLAELDRRRGFLDFVLERAGSEDYRRHFGLISVVRGDLEKLANHLGSTDSPPRIVLYVDDLDRCPPSQVVEVLQAVHLLLAFPLFVVVVGVDPRWLLRSLEHHYEEVLAPRVEGDGHPAVGAAEDPSWESTPQNYLEKIFQIPYALRPMGPDGFGRLVDKLLVPGQSATTPPAGAGFSVGSGGVGAPPSERGEEPPVDGGPDGTQPTARSAGGSSGSGPSRRQAAGDRPQPAPAAAVPSEPIEPNPAALAVSEEEVRFVRSLGGLVETPREAKRLVNVYRLMRASVPPNEVDEFVAARAYEPLLVLLAVLVGYPHEARSLFRALRESRRSGHDLGRSWRLFVHSLKPVRTTPDAPYSSRIDARLTNAEAERWTTIIAALQTLPDTLSDDLADYCVPLGLVERYSFDTVLAGVARSAAPPAAAPTTEVAAGPHTATTSEPPP